MKLADKFQYCASCHGQYVERQHVDFGSFFDGPTINVEGRDAPVPIDDLIICDRCLTNAGKLIGLYPAEELKKENEELGKAVEAKEREVTDRDELISDLTHTVEKLSNDKIQKPSRRPRMLA